MTHNIPFTYPIRKLICLLAIVFMAAAYGCSKPSPAEILGHADEAIAQGQAADAVESCRLLDNADLTPSQHCHCALIYAKAAQLAGEPEHMALAAASLKQACQQSADSVLAYISSLKFTDMAILNEVYGLCNVDNSKFPIEDDEIFEDEGSLENHSEEGR